MGARFGIPSLRSGSVQNQTDVQLSQAIRYGRNKMPAYAGKLSENQIAQLLAYIRELGGFVSPTSGGPPETSAPAPGDGDSKPPIGLEEGQTPREVETALGKPEDVTRVKENLIYTYPTVKVFFENGKLVNVQEREQTGEAQEKTAPEIVVLKGNPMGGVKFMHSAHATDRSIKCDTCHHASKPENAATGKTQACSDCHAKTAAAPMKTTYKLAFHDAMAKQGTCIDCHRAENAKGKEAPVKCTACHKRENL